METEALLTGQNFLLRLVLQPKFEQALQFEKAVPAHVKSKVFGEIEPCACPKTEVGNLICPNVSQEINLDSPSSSVDRSAAFCSFEKRTSLENRKQIEISTLKISHKLLLLASFGGSFTAPDNFKVFKVKRSYSIASLLVDVFPR